MSERPHSISMRVCLNTFWWLCGALCAVIAVADAGTQPQDWSRHVTSFGLPGRLCTPTEYAHVSAWQRMPAFDLPQATLSVNLQSPYRGSSWYSV
jgi:hypothetical protein